MKLREVVDVIDLEQDIKVLVDGAEAYSGPLEGMCAGQLLVMEQDEVGELEATRLIVKLKTE